MNQWWLLLKMIVLTFVPLPINPRVKRPDPSKNFWTFECDGFTSCFETAKVFYTDTLAARLLAEEKCE
jgi:hypothetical protein